MNGTQRKSSRAGREGASDEVREVLDSIRRIIRLLRVTSRDAERKVGLSGAQLFVLHKLTEAEMLSVNELAQRTHTHQSSVSVVVQSLVDKGLVSRTRAQDDARRLEVTLTAAARPLLRKAPDAAQDRLIEAIEKLPPAARGQLAKSLARLVEEAGLGDEEAPMMFEDSASPRKGAASKPASKGPGRAAANASR
jgi:DNA-binding MarR family transcriptional regulator